MKIDFLKNKKFKKLVKNPKGFFIDAYKKRNKIVGKSKEIFPKNKNSEIKKSEVKKDARSNCDAKLFYKANNYDLWGNYKSIKNKNGEKQEDIVIFPSGIFSIDLIVFNHFEKSGFQAKFLPIWDLFGDEFDIDDIEFQIKSNAFYSLNKLNYLINWIFNLNPKFIVLPYDCTHLSRAIVLEMRNFGIKTVIFLNDVYGYKKNYSQSISYKLPAADCILADKDMILEYQFPISALKNVYLLEERLEKPEIDNEVRKKFGIYGNERLCVFIAPSSQHLLSDDEIKLYIEKAFFEFIEKTKETDFILVLSKSKKNGFLSEVVLKKLSSIYRKKIVFFHDFYFLYQLVESADLLFYPNSLRFKRVNGDNTFIYSSLSECEISDEYNESDISEVCKRNFQDLIFKEHVLHSEKSHFEDNFIKTDISIAQKILDAPAPAFSAYAVPDNLSNAAITHGRQKYLNQLLNSLTRFYGAGDLVSLIAAEFFVQWGAEPNEAKERPEIYRALLNRPRVYLEDAFIRSKGLWTDPNEPTYGIVVDTLGIYYDATKPNLLENILQSSLTLNEEQILRARRCINAIVEGYVSKYNYSPIKDISGLFARKRKILLVDQKVGDMSIKYGMANDETFFRMFKEAQSLGDDVDVLIKQHPCAINGSEDEAHFTISKLGKLSSNFHLIGFDINPYSLFDAVDEVWVVSSGMGFEALLAGKKVRCFGVPFYSNYGLTSDEIKIKRRNKSRSLEELFYVFYIMLSRYFDPETLNVCEVEKIIDHFKRYSYE